MPYTSYTGDAGIGMQVGAGFGRAYSEYSAGKLNRRLRGYEADVAETQARAAASRGQFDENQSEKRTATVVGAQRASFAGQGVVVGAGSSGAVAADTEAIGAADLAQIRANAAMESWGYKAQASSLRMQGALEDSQGKNAAVNSLLTAGSQGLSDYLRLQDGK